ncbi:hypothetical protein [Candidatus Coxiella mudrowiae]|uniref:hypothetical protein n=1 Tax=Candidatus Coxiella mudrowiae TaxID=2054173 RepID=UPI001F25DBEA|nr:hypothetical protein [Candidatus Coxiella mudrowiae]
MFYLQGKVVSQDYEKAINWLIQSALKGNSQAQFFSGTIYEYCIKVKGKTIFNNFDNAKVMYNLTVNSSLYQWLLFVWQNFI